MTLSLGIQMTQFSVRFEPLLTYANNLEQGNSLIKPGRSHCKIEKATLSRIDEDKLTPIYPPRSPNLTVIDPDATRSISVRRKHHCQTA